MLDTLTQTELDADDTSGESPSPQIEIDPITRKWMRNKSDELAVANGCRFDEERGQFACDWMESHCHLYEGSNELMKLLPWEREATMRIYGWVRWGTNLPSGGPDRWIRRFTYALVMLPKKGGKSPWLAATTLYETAGDGEQGNHIAFAAADRNQANIAAKHAVEMVKASPELSETIDINLTEMKLTHRESKSDARPISSSDKKAAQSKQGWNGSVRVDELHVITQQFISESSLDRAGSSRDEPLFLAVSTAGKDPNSYGRKMYDYGKSVESGDVADERFFFLCYEATQDLSDADLEADPSKWGRIANPAWGILTREEEFLADYNRSKRSMADLADFKTFRLNIWQQASSPWLKMADWSACRRDFTETDLLGRTACVGLDLSKTRDMTALVLVFPWDDGAYRILPYFFLPETAVQRLAVKFPQFLDWVARGYITMTDANVTDYHRVRDKVLELSNKFYIPQLNFDPNLGAEGVIQMIRESVSIVCEAFAQTIIQFNPATQEFERLVIDGKMHHNGNPCLTWQMGHCQVKTDSNCNKRPVKPDNDDPRKIDGCVASIMALAGAMGQSCEAWIG